MGTISAWNENKIPVYTQKPHYQIFNRIWEISEDVKNLGTIFNVQDMNQYVEQLQAKIDAVKSQPRNR